MSSLPCRVLLADDDPTMGLLMRAALAADDFDLTVVVDGVSALEAFYANPHDLVLLDVEMPGLDGFDVCGEIRRSHGNSVPIVLITSHNDVTFLQRAQEMQADYLGKPVNWNGIAALLRRVLGQAA